MNIAIFASAFHPHLGGVEELCRQLALEFLSRGVGVVVLTNRWPRSLPPQEVVEGIPVHRLAMRVPDGSPKAYLSYGLTYRRVLRETLQIVRKHAVDVLHVQCVSCNAYYALAVKSAIGLPLVVSLQGELGMDASGLFQRSGFARNLMRRTLLAADAITACSGQTLEEAAQFMNAGPPSQFGRVIFNGVSLSDFEGIVPHKHPRPYILAIGRHVPQKGFDLLLRAFDEAGEIGHDLLLAGDGSESPRLREFANCLRARDKIHFLGRVTHDRAVELFAGCSFFALPSRHEPQGIVNLEAMAASKAVLASRVGGVPEIVTDGETGVLLPAEDTAAWVAAIRRLCSEPGFRDRLGDAGRARSTAFDWKEIASRYLETYVQAAATRSPTSGVA
jgi:glycosyltransferase involved in cell wall biosynthesis